MIKEDQYILSGIAVNINRRNDFTQSTNTQFLSVNAM